MSVPTPEDWAEYTAWLRGALRADVGRTLVADGVPRCPDPLCNGLMQNGGLCARGWHQPEPPRLDE